MGNVDTQLLPVTFRLGPRPRADVLVREDAASVAYQMSKKRVLRGREAQLFTVSRHGAGGKIDCKAMCSEDVKFFRSLCVVTKP